MNVSIPDAVAVAMREFLERDGRRRNLTTHEYHVISLALRDEKALVEVRRVASLGIEVVEVWNVSKRLAYHLGRVGFRRVLLKKEQKGYFSHHTHVPPTRNAGNGRVVYWTTIHETPEAYEARTRPLDF